MFRSAGNYVVATLAAITLTSLVQAQGYTPRGFNPALATRDYLVNRPTVSPYLNLLRVEGPFSAPNYQTMVRPALEQRQDAARQQASINQLQSRVTNMQGQLAARSQGGQEFATGHPSRFATYLHYYPGLQPIRRRR